MSALLNESKNPKVDISEELVQSVYKKRVLGIECKTYFEHYFQRLSIYYEPEEVEIVKELLQELATQDTMQQKQLYLKYQSIAKKATTEQFNDIIGTLQNEFYISWNDEKKSFSFTTRILKDLWLYRYG